MECTYKGMGNKECNKKCKYYETCTGKLMAAAVKEDCFAYKDGKCAALREIDCEKCGFYKKKGTECDTCKHKGKNTCKLCRVTGRKYQYGKND